MLKKLGKNMKKPYLVFIMPNKKFHEHDFEIANAALKVVFPHLNYILLLLLPRLKIKHSNIRDQTKHHHQEINIRVNFIYVQTSDKHFSSLFICLFVCLLINFLLLYLHLFFFIYYYI